MYQHQKNDIIQAWISCRRSYLVKIIPEPSATRNTVFKIIRADIEIGIILPRIAFRVSSRHRRYTTNVQGHRVRVKA